MVGEPVVAGVYVGFYPDLFLAAVERRALREAVAQMGRHLTGMDKTVVDDQQAQRQPEFVALKKMEGGLVVELVEKFVLRLPHEGVL